MQYRIMEAAAIIGRSQRLVVLTGAGMSKESGVPTFRDEDDGLWTKYDPAELATPEAFQRDPRLVWEWYTYRREIVRQAAPNPGHYALVELEDLLPQVVVITQNVDDLHQRAGSSDVIPLHGAIMRSRCTADCRGGPTAFSSEAPVKDGLPRCPYCGALARPDVVWFGENLPAEALLRAMIVTQEADVMLVVGTSGVVQPVAALPSLAFRAGATLIEVNPNASAITSLAALWLDGPAGEILPQLVAAIRARRGGQ